MTNDELARELATRGVETSDEWIVARTGIRQRYLAEPGLTTSALGARAATGTQRRGFAGDVDILGQVLVGARFALPQEGRPGKQEDQGCEDPSHARF